jgi:hypothetical protein
MVLWTLHEHDAVELDEYLREFVDKTGVAFPTAKRYAVLKVIEGEEGVDRVLVALAEWMGEDVLKYFVVRKYGDVTDRLVSERNRKRREIERKRKEKEVWINTERERFVEVIDQIIEAHKWDASLHAGWDDELKEHLSSFVSKDIDWTAECRRCLDALSRIPHCYAKLLWRNQELPRRKIVWKLVCMLYVFGGTVQKIEIDGLLRSATHLSTEGYRKRIVSFINKYFNISL